MKSKHNTRPADVSKSLFMDLAFLLIAALVLMVNEPANAEANRNAESMVEEKAAILEKVKKLELRPSAAKEVIESATGGESIFLRQSEDGQVFEITAKGEDLVLESEQLKSRIEGMERPRYTVLHIGADVAYEKYSELRDSLQQLKSEGILDFCIEATKAQ